MHANVIGAGIAGPMAAITLAENGYEVDVYDNRVAADLVSDGVLGIVDESWEILTAHGVTGAHQRELASNLSKYHYLTWTDLHRSLVERGSDLGVRYHYGEHFEAQGHTDLTVWATGVGSAKEVTHGEYTGYVIVRGLAYQFAGTAWTAIQESSPECDWLFAVGDTRDGASVTMFVPRKNATMRTTYSQTMPLEANRLPLRWRRLLETVSVWQTVPMSDWDVPGNLIMERGDAPVIRIGDANGQLRPKTSMGANRAIAEGANVDLLIHQSAQAEHNLLAHRRELHDLGIALGI